MWYLSLDLSSGRFRYIDDMEGAGPSWQTPERLWGLKFYTAILVVHHRATMSPGDNLGEGRTVYIPGPIGAPSGLRPRVKPYTVQNYI